MSSPFVRIIRSRLLQIQRRANEAGTKLQPRNGDNRSLQRADLPATVRIVPVDKSLLEHDDLPPPSAAPMMPAPSKSISRAPDADRQMPVTIDVVMLITILLMFLIGPLPFQNNSDAALKEAGEAGFLAIQLSFSAVGIAAAIVVLRSRLRQALWLLRPAMIAVMVWLAASPLQAAVFEISAKRVVFAFIVFTLAAAAAVLPRNERDLSRILGGVAALTLGLCYFGIIALPDLAIHHDTDVLEPQLAGKWRGVYIHKNVTSPAMVILMFIGLFVARTGRRNLGLAIVGLSVIFLIGSGGKTSLALALPVLAISELCFALPNRPIVRTVSALFLVVVLNVFTVGSVVFPAVQEINKSILPDPSFTGRTEIWTYALEKIRARPIAGYGFGAFWRSDSLLHSEHVEFNDAPPGQTPAWVKLVSHSHNGFVDVALTTGLGGLALVFAWLVVAPLADFGRILPSMKDRAMTRLFFRIWLFALHFASLEAVLFDRSNPVWFAMLFAVFGLRLATRFELQPQARPMLV